MTSVNRHLYLIAIAAAVLSGCATAKLQLDLAIYKEDPLSISYPSPERIELIINDLETIGQEALAFATARKEVGKALVEVVGEFSALRGQVVAKSRGKQYTQDDVANDQAIFRSYSPKYEEAIDAQAAQVKKAVENARQALAEYEGLLKATPSAASTTLQGSKRQEPRATAEAISDHEKIFAAQLVARDSVERVLVALKKLRGNLETDLEGYLRSSLPRWAKEMTPATFTNFGSDAAAQARVSKLAAELQHLQAEIEKLNVRGKMIAGTLEKRLSDLQAKLQRSNQEASKLSQTVNDIANVVTSIPASLSFGDGGTQAISDITGRVGLLSSQIERLQDPSDPVWRIVTDPGNADKWNDTFSKTYFYAEGNASVVVVRDTPTDFRVQQGANNPAALVQAQLQVSRAIGNAALTIAGAAAGVDPSAFGSQSQVSSDASAPSPAESDAEKLARRQATVREQRAFRASVARGLVVNLRNFRSQLSNPKVGNTATDAKPIVDNMINAMQGYQKVLHTDSAK